MSNIVTPSSSMSCAQSERYLEAYVDGELGASELMRIESHLASCNGCTERAAIGRATKRALRASARAEVAPASLRARIAISAARVEEVENRRARALRVNRPSWRSATPWAAAACFALVVGGGFHSVHRNVRDDGRDARADARSVSTAAAASLEEFTLQQARPLPPEEIDPERIHSVFSPIVGVPVHAARFAGLVHLGLDNQPDGDPRGGYVFAGARLVPVHDEPTATLFYTGRGGRVTVFVYDPQRISVNPSCCMVRKVVRHGDVEKTVLLGQARNGYSLALAQDKGVGYAVSGDLAEPELVSIASEL